MSGAETKSFDKPDQEFKQFDNESPVVAASDAFFPFRDNIDRAQRSGVEYLVQAGGSTRDDLVIEAADEYRMLMINSGVRLFHH